MFEIKGSIKKIKEMMSSSLVNPGKMFFLGILLKHLLLMFVLDVLRSFIIFCPACSLFLFANFCVEQGTVELGSPHATVKFYLNILFWR